MALVMVASALTEQCLRLLLDHSWSSDCAAVCRCSLKLSGCFFCSGGDLCCLSSGLADLHCSSRNSWWLECLGCPSEKLTTSYFLVAERIAFIAHHSFSAARDTAFTSHYNFVVENWSSYGCFNCFEQHLYDLENSISSCWRITAISNQLAPSFHEYRNN